MKLVLFFLYLLVSLLDNGHGFYSCIHHHPGIIASNRPIEEQVAFLNKPEVRILFVDLFSNLNEENTDDNDDSNDDKNSNGKVFAVKNSLQNSWSSHYANQFITFHRSIPFLSFSGNTAPIYLANRALRI